MLALKYVELVDRCRSDGIEGYRLCCILCGAEERNMLRSRCFGCGKALDREREKPGEASYERG